MRRSRVELEKEMVVHMIKLYYKKYGTQEEEEALIAYAMKRLSYCKFGEEKTFCSKCPIHCYAPKYKLEIKKVMKYSGPRMLFVHPIMTINHLLGL